MDHHCSGERANQNFAIFCSLIFILRCKNREILISFIAVRENGKTIEVDPMVSGYA